VRRLAPSGFPQSSPGGRPVVRPRRVTSATSILSETGATTDTLTTGRDSS
jgi:hypothetical protein